MEEARRCFRESAPCVNGGGMGESGIGRDFSGAHLHAMGLGLSSFHRWNARSFVGMGGGGVMAWFCAVIRILSRMLSFLGGPGQSQENIWGSGAGPDLGGLGSLVGRWRRVMKMSGEVMRRTEMVDRKREVEGRFACLRRERSGV